MDVAKGQKQSKRHNYKILGSKYIFSEKSKKKQFVTYATSKLVALLAIC